MLPLEKIRSEERSRQRWRIQTMGLVKPLEATALYQRCDPRQFAFATTAELEDLTEVIGQRRAVEAVSFGIGIRRDGFNLFALGPEETGKYGVVRHYLERQAATHPPPADWCYINNFAEPHKPHALRLPPGGGVGLRRDMERLVEELRTAIPATFESENYRARRQEIEEEFRERQEKALANIQRQAQERGLALLRTPMGLAFAPMRGGQVISPEDFQKLPPECGSAPGRAPKITGADAPMGARAPGQGEGAGPGGRHLRGRPSHRRAATQV
jgi:AAA domain